MKRATMLQRLTLSYCLLIVLLLAMVGAAIVPQQLHELQSSLDARIMGAARLLAGDTDIRSALMKGQVSDGLMDRLDGVIAGTDNLDFIVLADKSGSRLYHPDHERIGQTFVGGDEKGILQGEAPYMTTEQGSMSVQRRAFHAVTDESGSIAGFLMVSASMDTVRAEQKRILTQLGIIFAAALVLGLLLAYLIARGIRRELLGHEPSVFARMYLQQEEVLDNLNEGVTALAPDGSFLFRNAPARVILPGEALPEDFPLRPDIDAALRSGETHIGLMLELDERTLLAKTVPLKRKGKTAAILLVWRDRTEFTRMAEQLTGTDQVIQALRANTHEYLNKLHVISGLLQIGDTQQAMAFIDGVVAETENSYQWVVRQIENRTLAALLLGKTNHAKELDIQFSLRRDSRLEAHNPYLSARDLVTVVGNLIENAFDAVKNRPFPRQVEVFIGQSEEGLTITVDDTGCGMTPEQIETLRARQYTTKGEGHGFGLRLIQQIVREHGGYLEIESEPGEGSSFTASFDKKRTVSAGAEDRDR
ncbi:MAG: sensor histidine kinase [Christensenellaceae bacterium]|nr:sensor histidine kinase [Christensenellaceae bacterium]